MSTPQNQFGTQQNQFDKIAQQSQDAVSGAVRTWADTVQRLSGQPGSSVPDVGAVVDNAFDFAERLLATQREFTKSVLEAYASTSGKVTDATAQTLNRATEQGTEAGQATANTTTDAADSAADSVNRGADAAKSSADATKSSADATKSSGEGKAIGEGKSPRR